MKKQVRKEFVPLFSRLARDKSAVIGDPKLARCFGKELKRLGIRENVVIGRDNTSSKTVAVLIGIDGTKGKYAWFEFNGPDYPKKPK